MAIALDSNNDMYAENGAIKRVLSGAQVVQNVRTRLLTSFSECFLDTTRGVPYFEEILVKPVNLPGAESILKQTISETNGLEELVSFQLQFESATRRLTVIYSATTTAGDAVDATVNIGV